MIGPTKKRSKAKKHQRHSSWQYHKVKYWLNKIQLIWSDEGQCDRLTHRVCPQSGYYNGKQVMNVKKKKQTVIEA